MWPELGSNQSGEKPNGLRVNSPIHQATGWGAGAGGGRGGHRPRLDVAERGILSASPLFANSSTIFLFEYLNHIACHT